MGFEVDAQDAFGASRPVWRSHRAQSNRCRYFQSSVETLSHHDIAVVLVRAWIQPSGALIVSARARRLSFALLCVLAPPAGQTQEKVEVALRRRGPPSWGVVSLLGFPCSSHVASLSCCFGFSLSRWIKPNASHTAPRSMQLVPRRSVRDKVGGEAALAHEKFALARGCANHRLWRVQLCILGRQAFGQDGMVWSVLECVVEINRGHISESPQPGTWRFRRCRFGRATTIVGLRRFAGPTCMHAM